MTHLFDEEKFSSLLTDYYIETFENGLLNKNKVLEKRDALKSFIDDEIRRNVKVESFCWQARIERQEDFKAKLRVADSILADFDRLWFKHDDENPGHCIFCSLGEPGLKDHESDCAALQAHNYLCGREFSPNRHTPSIDALYEKLKIAEEALGKIGQFHSGGVIEVAEIEEEIDPPFKIAREALAKIRGENK